MQPQQKDYFGYFLICSLFVLLSYAGYQSYIAIDWTVLKRLESQKLVLPTPLIASPSAALKK